MSEQPTKFCKDCANFKAPDLCYIGEAVNMVNGGTLPEYMDCHILRSRATYSDGVPLCGPSAKRFVEFNPALAPKHRSSIGFIIDGFRRKTE